MNSQHELIQALAGCTYAPGTWSKRFVRDVASLPHDKELTAKQEACAWRLAYTFRRQMPRSIAEEALRLKIDHRCTKADPYGWFTCEICLRPISKREVNGPCPGPPDPKPERKPKKTKAAAIQQDQPASTQEGLF